jgi:dolichol-phosphate mannosyltransferase
MTPYVVVPTYNEKENIPELVGRLLALPVGAHVIVVDDNSPDGTGRIADELAAAQPRVHVLHRPRKLGLGTAYVAGFAHALAAGAELVITMDADFSHDPSYIPNLVALAGRVDVAIGSRYVPDGGVRNWGWHRRLLSWGANTFARGVLGLAARDCTAGFRCYRRAVLQSVQPERLRSNGYSFLVEMLFECQRRHFTIGESPIVFVNRQRGASKISRSEISKAMLTVLRLFRTRLRG